MNEVLLFKKLTLYREYSDNGYLKMFPLLNYLLLKIMSVRSRNSLSAILYTWIQIFLTFKNFQGMYMVFESVIKHKSLSNNEANDNTSILVFTPCNISINISICINV